MVYVRACVCVRARLLACVRVRVCMQMTIIPAAVSRCGSFSDNKHWVALVNSVTLSCQHCNKYKESYLSNCAIIVSNQEACMFFDNLSSKPGLYMCSCVCVFCVCVCVRACVRPSVRLCVCAR